MADSRCTTTAVGDEISNLTVSDLSVLVISDLVWVGWMLENVDNVNLVVAEAS